VRVLAHAVSLAMVAASTLPVFAGGSDGAALVSISLAAAEGQQLVVAVDVIGFGDLSGHVTLSVERRSASGTASIEQGHDVELPSGESVRAATLSVNFMPGDSLRAVASLSVGDAIISTATTETGSQALTGSGDPR
jgi:hypothetical protein